MSYYKGGRGGNSYRGGSSYRGSRGEGSSWRGSRGSFSGSSRGSRYSSYPSPSYESRSRSSYPGGATDRYPRGREDYHRYSQDVGGYSAREYGRGLSPEPPRKRARPDSSPPYMAPRRSHERSFASDYSSGRSFYDKGGSSSGGAYITEKAYTREVRERGNDFAFRKPGGFSSPRGGFRGRSGRGLKTRGFRSTSSFLRKRDAFAIRKRALSSRSEYLRRLKQLKLRRRLRQARRQKASSDEEADQDEDKEDEDNEEEEEGEEGSGAEEEGSSGGEEEEEQEDEEGGEKEGDEVKAEGEESNEVKEEKTDEDKEKKEEDSPKKAVTKTKKKVKKGKKKIKAAPKDDAKSEGGEKDEDKEKEDNEEESDKPALTDFLGQPFIKLKCPHCHHVCVTFKEYSKHLETRKHQNSMQELFTKLRKTLATMRADQRKKQRALDEECKTKNMRLRTFFCAICKLNYRTLKAHHQASASHRKMSEFLLPFCKVCRVWFKSAWAYESHLCELPHIKKKARLEKLSRPPSSKDHSLLDQDAEDLDNSGFMILDAVGSGDDSEAEKSDDGDAEKKEGDENEKTDEKTDKDAGEKKKKKKSEIKLGAEFCKLVEVFTCDLCKVYLPRLDDKERALSIHCRSRPHLQRYVKFNNSKKDDATLRRKAVRLHKEKQKQKEKVKKEKKESVEVKKEEEETEKTVNENEEGAKPTEEEAKGSEGENVENSKEPAVASPANKKNTEEDEEKMWSEVDKDLSDLLHEGDEHPDDEEDIDTSIKERYDRFKKSDKNSVGDADIKANGTLPVGDKKKVAAGEEDK